MIIPLDSPLEGPAAERFLSVARSLSRRAELSNADRRHYLEQELAWCRNNARLNGGQLAYEASVRVLIDLVRLGWQVREEGYGIELVAEKKKRSGLDPSEILAEKSRARAVFQPLVESQFRDPAVQAFVKRMESPSKSSGKKSVTNLIGDGPEIHARLRLADSSDSREPTSAIEPYLQLVTSDATDEHTGLGLREIWRYFRYSWSIPQFSTPGRQLLYLVRDAAHPCHAVMGIIGLNNSALQMGTVRETHLGWNFEAVTARMSGLAADEPDQLSNEIDWMEAQIADALDDVETDGLAQRNAIENPTPEVVAGLRRRAKEFDRLRDETLRDFAAARSGADVPGNFAELENFNYGHPPVDEEMLDLEAKPGTRPEIQKARRHLVARKRAALLADLLHARMTLRTHRETLVAPKSLEKTLALSDVRIAVNTVLAALKSRFAGINMLEISTCGAIPPYNHLLAGKLASLLLYSPRIAADYRRIYGGPSIIASQLKNRPVRRPNELVYLGTTSLYAQGSSQYERLKLPAGVIAPDQPELRFQKVGLTSGYGTLQFPAETREVVNRHLETVQEFRDINSIFGEGSSPKLRKLVAGMRIIGFPPDALMRHNHPRLIYSVPLFPGALRYLNARPCELPSYIREPEAFPDATRRICDFWKSRWLASRLRHQPSVLALQTARSWKLSDRMSLETTEKPEPASRAVVSEAPDPTLWHQLAASGPQVTSDALTPSELEKLHVSLPIEDFIRERVASGTSVFLTGNAGDGKTHLLRRLGDDIAAAGAEVIEDATALMRHENLNPVLDRWKKAVAEGRPLCLAINEYPLYLLRREATDHLPELAEELDRQIASRLAYGPEKESENARQPILVIDLSLRNPLRSGFVSACLDRLLADDDLGAYASADSGSTLARNLERLRNPTVRKRLYLLFDRLATEGTRATIRELWIVLSRMVLGYRADLRTPLGEGTSHWYSETLFQDDRRFPLFAALRGCDPAAISHPLWDARLEEADPGLESGWPFGMPRPAATVRPGRKEFFSLKRAFFFEHANGTACLDLAPKDLNEYRELVEGHADDDPLKCRQIVSSINRAYAPVSFEGIEDGLFLWNGHRFHEQPSEIFLANRRIPADQLRLFRPRLPRRLQGAFPDYQPDHLALLKHDSTSALLKIDAALFQTLKKLYRGLPRKLLAESDTFRLENFLDHLHREAPSPDRRVLSAHLKRRELLDVRLSTNERKYERIVKG